MARSFGSARVALPILLAALAALVAPQPASAARGRPRAMLAVTSPANGTFSNAGSITVTGQVTNLAPDDTTVLEVNGVVVPVQADGSFSTSVALNPSIVFNPIETRLVSPRFIAERRVVVAGESVADGAFSTHSVALRLNDSGLDQLEPVVTSLVDLNLAELLPPGTVVIDNFCYASLFGLCIGRVRASIEGSPPPSIGSFGIDIDSQPNMAFGDILLNNLFVRSKVQSISGVGFTCHINVSAATTDILGDYTLEPLAADPQFVDVAQSGGANVVFGGFSSTTDCDGFLGGIVEFFIGLLVGDIQSLMEPAFEDFLNTADANGNTPVAGAIETALSGIQIAGPIGQGLNVVLDAPLFEVAEDAAGITLGADARMLAQVGTPGCTPPPGTPDLTASYDVPETFPSFGANTPVGNLPYDLGIAISTSAFNQLLKAQIECGLLQTDLTTITLFGVEFPITAGLINLLLPEFSVLNPSRRLIARIQPTIAPALTGHAGPAGELAELRAGQLSIELRDAPGGDQDLSFLKIGIDFRVGLDFEFDGATGQLTPTISTIDPADVTAGVIRSAFQTVTPEDVQNAVPSLIQGALPVLATSLGSFPIPSFFGFQLAPVETGKNGDFLAIFANLEPAP